MTELLKRTTSIGLIMMMGLPSVSFAQVVCGEGEFPCTLADGRIVETSDDLAALLAAGEAEKAQAEAAAQAEADAAAQAAADEQAAAQAAAAAEAAAAERAAAQVEAEAAAQAAADEQAAAQAAAEAAAAEQAAAQAEADAAAQAAADEQAAAQAAAEAEVAAAEQAAAQAEADAAAQDETTADAPVVEQEKVVATPEVAPAEDTETASDESVETDGSVAPAASTEAAADTPATEEPASAEETATIEQTAQDTASQEALAEQAEAEEQQRIEAQAERARAEAQSLAAADANETTTGEVVEETVAVEDVRSSSEEFETAVTSATTSAAAPERDGLSNFEKVLLLGLGAAVVGTVLSNGDEVRSNSGDRVIVERDGQLRVLKDDDALLRRPGSDVRTETFDDGSSRTTVTKPDQTRIVTIRGADGTVLRRLRILPDGQEFTLFDDTQVERDVIVSQLPQVIAPSRKAGTVEQDALLTALQAEARANRGAAFSLRQIRTIAQVRALAPEIELDAVRFASGSAAIAPEQARSLTRLGTTLRDLVVADPRTVLLVEGHTDAVGDAAYNLALSDRRAETVALALTEYFGVPEENMIVQGYGESQLKVQTQSDEQANRRAVVRNITELLR